MMPVRYMRPIEDVLETGNIPPVVTQAAERWGQVRSLHRYRTSDSFVFRLETADRRLALRMHDGRYRSASQVGAGQSLAAHLVSSGVPAPYPVPSKAGRLVETLVSDETSYHVGCLEWLQGTRGDRVKPSADFLCRWGLLLSKVHAAMQEVDSSLRGTFGHWDQHIKSQLQNLPDDPTLRATVEETLIHPSLSDRSHTSYGLCHCDAQPDNLIVVDGVPHIIDFDTASGFWYAGDIGLATEEVLDAGQHDDKKTVAFMQGYGSAQLRGADMGIFQKLSLLKGLVVLESAYIGSDPSEDPSWLAGMRGRHERASSELRRQLSLPPTPIKKQ